MRMKAENRAARFLGQCEQPTAKVPRMVDLAPAVPERPLAPHRRKNVRPLPEAITQHLGSGISFEHLGRAETLARHEGCSDANAQFDFDPNALRLVRHVPKGAERALEMANRLLICTTAQGPCRGALVVGDRPTRLAAAFEMLRDLGRNRIQVTSPGLLEPYADARMALGATCRRQSLVKQLSVEIMAEAVQLRQRAIGPSGRAALDNE